MRQSSAHLTTQGIQVGEINTSHCDISTPSTVPRIW
jgi:hypothetical protein